MQASSVYVREMFAIVESVKKWHQYLIGRHFHIFTDKKSLKNLLVQTIQTPEQQKWAAKLQEFSFDINYKPDKSNLVEDALSRKFTESTPGVLFMTTSSILPSLLTSLHSYYNTNSASKELATKATSDVTLSSEYQFKDRLVYFKGRIFIPDI